MAGNVQKILASSLSCVLQETNVLGDHDIELKVAVHVEEDQKPSFIDLVKTGIIKCSNFGVGVIQRNVCNGCSSCGKDLICLDRQLELVFSVIAKKNLCYNCHADAPNTEQKRKRGRPRKKLKLTEEHNVDGSIDLSAKDETLPRASVLPEKDQPLHRLSDLPEKDQTLHSSSDLPEKDETLHSSADLPEKDEMLHKSSDLPEKDETLPRSSDLPEKTETLQSSHGPLCPLDHIKLMPKIVLTRIDDVDIKPLDTGPALEAPGPPHEEVSTPCVGTTQRSDAVESDVVTPPAASFSPPVAISTPSSSIRRSARTTKSRFRRTAVKNETTEDTKPANLDAANRADPSGTTPKVGGKTKKVSTSSGKRPGRKPEHKDLDSPQVAPPLKRKKGAGFEEDISVHYESGDEAILDNSVNDPDFDISTVSEDVADHEIETVSGYRTVAVETTVLKKTTNKEVISDKAKSPVKHENADKETRKSHRSPDSTGIVHVPVPVTPGCSAKVLQEEYACLVCHKSFPMKRYLMRHLNKAGTERVQCDICAAAFHSQADVEQHKLAHSGIHPYVCEVCHKSFPNPSTANKHVKTHLAPHERPFICMKCGKGFTEQHSLREHSYIHAEHRPYACDQCDSKFGARYLLNAHMKYHGTKKYRCYTCNRMYKVYASLMEHIHVHKDHYTEDTAEPIQKAPRDPKPLDRSKEELREEKKRRTYLKHMIKAEKSMRESLGLKSEDVSVGVETDANDSAIGKINLPNITLGLFEKECLDLIVCEGVENGGHQDIDEEHVEEEEHADDEKAETEDTQKTAKTAFKVKNVKMKGSQLKYGCKICFRKYLSKVTLDKHYQKYGKVCFPCKQCKAKFHSKENREQHKLLHDGRNPFQCRICFKSFKCMSSCKKHTSTHLPTSRRPFICDICGKGYINNNELEYHKWTHNQTGSNKCTVCQKLFRTRSLLKRHMNSHKGRTYKCESCDKEYKYPSSLRDHLIKFKHSSRDVVTKVKSDKLLNKNTGKKQDKETAMCDVCGLTFNNIFSLRGHIRSHKKETTAQSDDLREFAFKKHVERIAAQKERMKASTRRSGLFSCDQCDKVFTLQHSLRRHKIMKHSICKHECTVCKKRFFVPSELKRHMIRHEGERTFQCNLCPQAFYHDFGLRRHLKVHISKEKLAYGCELCEKRFAEACYLREHMMKHTGERPFQCDMCDKGFVSNSLLKKHKLCHGPKTHGCTVCGRFFSQVSSLNTHMQTHEAVKQVYLCDDCGKSFNSKSGLNRHKVKHTGIRKHKCQHPGCERAFFFNAELKIHELCHGDLKPFQCETCGKSFKFRTSFKNHIQYHSKTKNYKCSICEKGFYLENKYKHHMERHLGERNLKCETCGKCFIRKSDLVYHQKQHKGKFKCQECEKVFSLETRLKSHMKVHEGPDKVKCPRCGIYFRDIMFLQTTHLRECDNKKCCRFCGRKFKRVRYLQSHIGVHTGKRPFECKVCGRAYGKEEHLRAHQDEHERKKYACNLCEKRFDRKCDVRKHEEYHRKKERENEMVEALKKDLAESSSHQIATQTSIDHSSFLDEVFACQKIKSEEERRDILAEATASISEMNECDVQVVQDMTEVQFIQGDIGAYTQVVHLDGNSYIQESALPSVSSEQVILTTIDTSQLQVSGGENEIIMVAMIPETQ
ncbi:zinc finger protein 91-like [Haliotis cracherodii]|uniref:zinc finger protein 91-like n=1 Tax=Haliotis cracherodii TaxID=6455 RepID=UPI0039ED977A